MVEPELALNGIVRLLILLHRHDTRVIDQDIDLFDAVVDSLSCLADRGEVPKLDLDELGFDCGGNLMDLVYDGVDFGGRAPDEDDVRGRGFGKGEDHLRAETACAGAGDDDWVRC